MKRFLVSLLVWLLLAAPCLATPTVFNIGTASASATTVQVTAISVAANNLVVVFVMDNVNGGATGSVSDTQSNSYTLLSSKNPNGSTANGVVQIFYSVITHPLSGSDNIKYTTASGSSSLAESAFYATGIVTASPVDTGVTATFAGSSSTASGTANAPAGSGELFVGAVGSPFGGSGVSITVTGAFTNSPAPVSVQRSGASTGGGYNVAGASAPAFSATLGSSALWGLIVSAFKPAAVTTVFTLTTTGAGN